MSAHTITRLILIIASFLFWPFFLQLACRSWLSLLIPKKNVSRFHFAFSYSRWTPRSSAVCPIWGSLHLMSHPMPSVALASKLVRDVLREKKWASQKTGFILVRPVILGTYDPHGSVMRSLRWRQWNHLPGRQHCNSGESDDVIWYTSPSIWRESGGLKYSLCRYSLKNTRSPSLGTHLAHSSVCSTKVITQSN